MSRGRLLFSSLADFDPSKESNALMVLSITKEEVVSCKTGVALDALMKLSDSEDVVKRHEDSLMLNFDGWDEDPRELYEIPEVRRYARSLASQWNYWFHFVSKESETLTLLLALLIDIDVHREQGRVGYIPRSANQLASVVHHLFEGMNTLHDQFHISFAENERISAACMTALQLD